jgi:transcriptional regulator GlxA family with amidase domain
MRIAILTFDGFNEIDSFVSLHMLNRMRSHGWRAEIVAPTPTVTSMNGVVVTTQAPLESAASADVVLFGSGAGGRLVARDPVLRDQIVLDPEVQLIGAQCSGTLLMSSLGLLDGLPACTDLVTKPWVVEAGVEVLDQPFVAHGRRATAGGCLASAYLATWVVASLSGRERAVEALRSVAPVGEPGFIDHAMAVVEPYLVPGRPAVRHTAPHEV